MSYDHDSRFGPDGPSNRAAHDRAVLDKVRALLNKAESTPFEAEAAAFTAKAHELMTRHALDAAMVAYSRSSASALGIHSVEIAISEPYVTAKSLLLQKVADASRCRSVFHHGQAKGTVFGTAADVASTELLYTSLLLQAQRALLETSRAAPAGARVRSRSFRSAFLMAFALRIGERLAEVNRHLIQEAESTAAGSVLPALRDQAAKVDAALREQFPHVRLTRVRGGSDAEGWAGGARAANDADLGLGRLAG